ncbi:FadR/GntR family transcriptional regulator [Kaistia dalseonensis]|uniref:DNA-binding FadR family transcriptional regulator n=1 Tax=Kaistia dalseonensis TaxID=410840 RepID=A0ABU0H975_9HYPH|nr:FadR/GntR family transcriptional regulator [Kaistia dalseonensis]MCX5496257.1 FadR/GntR family transcriptional regulator [Kaistia dalseonensis]MDQ0438875.1 DNA-binding FadR family transcriptional regulator [Kaistia dalseonensis]
MTPTDKLAIEPPSRDAAQYLERINTTTRGVAVLDALAEMIERAGLGVGDRIPPEISLAERLGVGRTTIREALNRWEGLGIIRRRRGAGTFLVARVPSSKGHVPTMIRLEGEALLRLLEVRRALESEVVRKATLNARPAQRTEISRLCDILLADVFGRRPWRKADAAFHGAIYEASGNPMFGQILLSLDHALERSAESPFGRDGFGLASFPPHRDLADAIVAGDADQAVGAINHILDIVEGEIRAIIDSDPSLA